MLNTNAPVSKEHVFGFITGEGFAGAGHFTNLRRGQALNAIQLFEPVVFTGTSTGRKERDTLSANWRVDVYCGEKKPEHLDERFYFVNLPPGIDEPATSETIGQTLLEFVRSFLESKRNDFQSKADKVRAAKLEGLRADGKRIPTAEEETKRKKIVERLLRKDWPRFSAANDKLRAATDETARERLNREVWIGFIADHQSVAGCPPEVNKEESAELWKDADYLRLMHDAMNKRAAVDRIDWTLANGWFAKGYCYLTAPDLRGALAIALNNTNLPDGESIARRAKRLGLPRFVSDGYPTGKQRRK